MGTSLCVLQVPQVRSRADRAAADVAATPNAAAAPISDGAFAASALEVTARKHCVSTHARTHARTTAPRLCRRPKPRNLRDHDRAHISATLGGSRAAPRSFAAEPRARKGMAPGRRSDSACLALRSTRPDGRPLHSRRAGSALCARSSSSSWDGRRFLSGARDGRVTKSFVIVMGNSPYR